MSEFGSVSVKVSKDAFDSTLEVLKSGLDESLTAIALRLQQQVKYNIQAVDAIDTGAMTNSVYVESSNVDERGEMVAAATSAAQSVGKHSGKSHPDIQMGEPSESQHKPFGAKVAVAVEYGIYVEMGTASRDEKGNVVHALTAPRPFMKPAADTVSGEAQGIASKVVKDFLSGNL